MSLADTLRPHLPVLPASFESCLVDRPDGTTAFFVRYCAGPTLCSREAVISPLMVEGRPPRFLRAFLYHQAVVAAQQALAMQCARLNEENRM